MLQRQTTFGNSHFLNVDISVTIKHSKLIFSVTILDIIREGILSQILYMRPGSDFMECRKYYKEIIGRKVPVFYHKITTRTQIKNLRHGSLYTNVIDECVKLYR